MHRRALILAAAALPLPALAQSWAPDRPLRMIIPVTPGGTPEDLAAMIEEELGRWRGVMTAQRISIA